MTEGTEWVSSRLPHRIIRAIVSHHQALLVLEELMVTLQLQQLQVNLVSVDVA